MSFYAFRAKDSCDICGDSQVQLHHVNLTDYGRRGHKYKQFNILSLCMMHHLGSKQSAHSMSQMDFAELYFGSEQRMWQFMFVKLAEYTLSLEEKG